VASAALASPTLLAAGAESPEGPTRGPARELWLEAQQLFQSADYVAAADRFDRAYELERSPWVGLWVARSLMHAGRWVDALERYREIAEQPLASDASSRDWSARRDAKSERQQLLPRVPSVIVVLDGATASEVTVELNAALLPSESIGVAHAVDPGLVHLRGERGKQAAEQRFEIVEGETKTVHLSFVVAASAPPDHGARQSPVAARSNDDRGELQRVISFVAIGVGGAALLTGGVFATLAAGDEGRLLRQCPMSRCPEQYRSSLET